MATTFKLKRKYFAEDSEKQGMSTGTKLALGAGAAALGFAGARRGAFGTGLMKQSNALWAKAGKTIGSQGMIKSGSKGVGVAIAKAGGADMATVAGKKTAIDAANKFKSTLTGPATAGAAVPV